MSQPIIRGIQAVGAVDIKYRYNGSYNSIQGALGIPSSIMKLGKGDVTYIATADGIDVAGFRLDGEFLRAVQQIASSVQVPILGGGAVALTNNNRSGTLTINATRVSTPDPDKNNNGKMYSPSSNSGLGPVGSAAVYDLVFLAQLQQAQEGGDSEGSTIQVIFKFCGLYTIVTFEGCTIASVDPLGLAGNDASNYNVQINYLNWDVTHSSDSDTDSEHPISLGNSGGNNG